MKRIPAAWFVALGVSLFFNILALVRIGERPSAADRIRGHEAPGEPGRPPASPADSGTEAPGAAFPQGGRIEAAPGRPEAPAASAAPMTVRTDEIRSWLELWREFDSLQGGRVAGLLDEREFVSLVCDATARFLGIDAAVLQSDLRSFKAEVQRIDLVYSAEEAELAGRMNLPDNAELSDAGRRWFLARQEEQARRKSDELLRAHAGLEACFHPGTDPRHAVFIRKLQAWLDLLPATGFE